MAARVILYSHPHAGSSILKCLLGSCPNVNEIIPEGWKIRPADYVHGKVNLTKWPGYTSEDIACFDPGDQEEGAPYAMIRKTVQQGHHTRVFLIREPRFAISSMIQRFQETPENKRNQDVFMSLVYWNDYIQRFLAAKASKEEYCVTYSEIFDHRKMEALCEDLGIQYTEEMWEQYPRRVSDAPIPTERPERTDHLAFRTWQINERVRNMNDEGNVIIPPELQQQLKAIPGYQEVFGG